MGVDGAPRATAQPYAPPVCPFLWICATLPGLEDRVDRDTPTDPSTQREPSHGWKPGGRLEGTTRERPVNRSGSAR